MCVFQFLLCVFFSVMAAEAQFHSDFSDENNLLGYYMFSIKVISNDSLYLLTGSVVIYNLCH